jgi:hypothetical protein
MALREFTDGDGVRWKAWDVTADQIHPKTKAEDYMHDLADGWLVFERGDGEEKRRLCPYPPAWEDSSDSELLALFAQAERVQRRQTPSLGSWRVGDAPIRPLHQRDDTPPISAERPRRPADTQKETGADDGTRLR